MTRRVAHGLPQSPICGLRRRCAQSALDFSVIAAGQEPIEFATQCEQIRDFVQRVSGDTLAITTRVE
jgi:hypothetical protein